MLNISQVILVRTDSKLCRKELTVHWSASNSLIRSYLQPCTNSMWGHESEAVAPIIRLYQTVDAQKEDVSLPNLLITLRRYGEFIIMSISIMHPSGDYIQCWNHHDYFKNILLWCIKNRWVNAGLCVLTWHKMKWIHSLFTRVKSAKYQIRHVLESNSPTLYKDWWHGDISPK